MARAVGGVVQQQVFGQAAQPHAGAVQPSVAAALEQVGGFELLQHAVQRGLGQRRGVGQTLEREVLVFGRNDFEQREQAQRGRVAVDFQGVRGGGNGLHRGMIGHTRH